jgi:predicted RNase H-like HicB family nuclease
LSALDSLATVVEAIINALISEGLIPAKPDFFQKIGQKSSA